jgi:hypothetical protein
MPTAAWIFFAVVGASMLPAVHAIGTAAGLRTELLTRLPGGSFLRTVLLHPEVLVDRLFDRIAANPLRWAVRSFLIAYGGGGVMFSLLEKDASVFDGLWWAYVTVFTVGFGDLSPAE